MVSLTFPKVEEDGVPLNVFNRHPESWNDLIYTGKMAKHRSLSGKDVCRNLSLMEKKSTAGNRAGCVFP